MTPRTESPDPVPMLARIAACSAGSIYDADTGWLVVWNGSQAFNVFDTDGVVHAFTAADPVDDPADADAMAADWIAAMQVAS